MKPMVRSLEYIVHPEFNDDSYDSCKDVQNPATSGSVMNLLCGPWGSALCTPYRWFEYMGTMRNGYSPFEITYNVTSVDITEDGKIPHNPSVTPCSEAPATAVS